MYIFSIIFMIYTKYNSWLKAIFYNEDAEKNKKLFPICAGGPKCKPKEKTGKAGKAGLF